MNDSTAKTASSLVIAEKRPQKPGGCVGIFFQLFDWNRRLAKKKLFSKKLLLPGRTKQPAKKFLGDDKLPKLRLIADENSGGFPSMKKNGSSNLDSDKKHEMRSPGLVARLMGLESIPAIIHKDNKCKKNSVSGFGSDRVDKVEACLDNGGGKQESRPQKIQKTGLTERRSVAKIGSDSFQFKNVLSRSRKHHQKLASPVKSPRSVAGKHSSRLISAAAAKILEPGIQPRNRAKCTMILPPPPKDEYYDSKGHSACRNCGTLLEEQPPVEICSHGSERSENVFRSGLGHSGSVSGLKNKSFSEPISDIKPLNKIWSHGSERNNPRTPVSTPQQKSESVSRSGPKHSGFNCVLKMESFSEPIPNIKPLNRYSERSRSSNIYNGRILSSAKVITENKDFVALNRSLSGRTRSRMPVKVDQCNKIIGEKNFCSRRDDSFSPMRKRRLINECSPGFDSKLSSCRKTETDKNSGVVSFTFSSQMKKKAEIPLEMGKRGGLVEFNCSSNSDKAFNLDKNNEKTCFKRRYPLRGDDLGALLERKLKELTCPEEDELAALGGKLPARTTAMILQELISALTTEAPYDEDDMRGKSVRENVLTSKTNIALSDEPKTAKSAVKNSIDSSHLSPGSVLEASFSNDSCISSSLDDNSGNKTYADSMDCSYDELSQTLEPEVDVSDSATSQTSTNRDSITDLLDLISESLHNINLDDTRLSGGIFIHSKSVILDSELLFWNKTQKHFSLIRFLHDELETLANHSQIIGFEETKQGNQLEGFLFDCIIEYFGSRYGQFSNCGFNKWKKLNFCMDRTLLVEELSDEVQGWAELAGLTIDELVEWEMSQSLGKWVDFEIEEFESGAEIEEGLVQILVDELVIDLWEMGSSEIAWN